MDKSIVVMFGNPEFGWVSVDFQYNDIHIDFRASDVLNDPIEELSVAVTELKENEVKRVAWWLEPDAYYFDFEQKGQNIQLTILETEDFLDKSVENKKLITITGDMKSIIEPFRIALQQFSSRKYAKHNWRY